MSSRKALLVAMLVVFATTLAIATAFAQVGPNNPSGGTWLRQTTEEGTGSFKSTTFGTSFGTGWSSWLGTFAASRSIAMGSPRSTDTRSILAVARRTSWKR